MQETKPDVTAAAVTPPTIKPAPIQPDSKPTGVIPAMPIPISIPIHTRPIKPVPAQQPQQPSVSPSTTSPQPVVSDTPKVVPTTDVQSVAENLGEMKISSATTATSSTGNAPGAGGYLIQPRRRQFASGTNAPKMDQDYDFESANAKFNKEEVAKEVAAQSTAADGNDASTEGPSAAQLTAALAQTSFYDKGKSFFDNISCENKDRSAAAAKARTEDGTVNPNSWKRGEERKLNMETFGQASIDYGGRYGRGYRGGRGGYRGGRGYIGGGGYGRGRDGSGRSNHWRGGTPRANGQNTSETAA